jgi:ribosomal protein S27AE
VTEFVEWLTGTHKCDCGAKYNVAVTGVPTGNVTCEKCGTLMDTHANRSFLAYARIPGDE